MINRLLTPLIILLATAAAAQPVASIVPETRVPASTFAIFPWDSLSTPQQNNDAHDCGFNLAGFCSADLLDTVQANGLQCFIRDPLIQVRGAEDLPQDEITSRVQAIAARSASHPATFGYHLLDEPKASLFPVIAKWTNAFHQAAPGKIAYTNLFPDYGGNLGADGPFPRYLENFLTSTKSLAYSYDHYALMEDGKLRPQYFSNLEDARAVTLKTGVPFWHVVLGNAHFNYAEPTPAGLRFQAYTSMAYGARGLGYFTFTYRERGNYRATATDAYGRRTPTFDMLRDVNLQVHKLAPTLATLKSTATWHTPQVPLNCKGIQSSQLIQSVSGPGQYLVGEFESQTSGPAILIVNTSLTSSTTFSIKPKQKATLQKVSSVTGHVLPFTAENNWLAPGQGMLLFLVKE